MIWGIVVIAVAVLAGLFIAWPVLAGAAGPVVDTASADPVDEALDRSLDAIREIEFDHATGHLSDVDFQTLDAEERSRAIALLRRRDAKSKADRDMPDSTEPPEGV